MIDLDAVDRNNRSTLKVLERAHLLVQTMGIEALRETDRRRSALRRLRAEQILRRIRKARKDLAELE